MWCWALTSEEKGDYYLCYNDGSSEKFPGSSCESHVGGTPWRECYPRYLFFCVFYALQFASSALLSSSRILSGQGWKGKLNNLVIQLRKNCNHPDLLAGQIDGSCMSLCLLSSWKQMIFFSLLLICLIVFFSWQISTLQLKTLLDSAVNSAYWRDCLFGYLPKITEYVLESPGS